MNSYRWQAFVVLEIPEPVRGVIQSIRNSLGTLTARLPVEITVAGSSGVGPIQVGEDKKATEVILADVLRNVEPFGARFGEVRRFPNTDIFYLEPAEREPFDRIHEALKRSGIAFGTNPWPYNPHCTLRGGPMNKCASPDDILSVSFPKEDFVIDTLSVYELGPSMTCELSFQARARGP